MLEKNLPANQKHQVFLNFAKDEVQLKQKLKIGLTEANVAKHEKAFRSLWMQLESQLEMDYSYLQLPYKKFRSNKHHWGMQNIHLHHTIIWLFNFLTHSAEIFFMTVAESRFWVSKMKLSEAILHRIYIVHKSKYVDTKQLRSIYFPVCSTRLIFNNAILLKNYAKLQR